MKCIMQSMLKCIKKCIILPREYEGIFERLLQNRSTDGNSKSKNMTRSGESYLIIRTNASPEVYKTRCLVE